MNNIRTAYSALFLNIFQAKISASEITDQIEKHASNGRYLPVFGLRVEVLSIDRENEQVIVGTRGITLPKNSTIKLGLIEFKEPQIKVLK